MDREVQTITTIFSSTGEINTKRTLDLVGRRMADLRPGAILVASTSGTTGLLAAQIFREKLIVVTHSTGFREPNLQTFDPEKRTQIEETGARLLTCQHALGGVNRAIRFSFQTYQVDEIIAHTLRIFGQGVKVCVEIALMAADAGLVMSGKPLICVAGTGAGADTALVLVPANAQRFFDLKIVEVICWPAPHHPLLPH